MAAQHKYSNKLGSSGVLQYFAPLSLIAVAVAPRFLVVIAVVALSLQPVRIPYFLPPSPCVAHVPK